METTAGLAGQISTLALYGLPPEQLNTYVADITAVTPQQAQAQRRRYFDPARADVVVVGDAQHFTQVCARSGAQCRARIPASELNLDSETCIDREERHAFRGVTLPKRPRLIVGGLLGRNILRVTVIGARAFCTISFAAGVVGDLSEPPTTGVRVVLRIPPELPSDTPRAPLPPMTSARCRCGMRRAPRQLRVEAPVEVSTRSVR